MLPRETAGSYRKRIHGDPHCSGAGRQTARTRNPAQGADLHGDKPLESNVGSWCTTVKAVAGDYLGLKSDRCRLPPSKRFGKNSITGCMVAMEAPFNQSRAFELIQHTTGLAVGHPVKPAVTLDSLFA